MRFLQSSKLRKASILDFKHGLAAPFHVASRLSATGIETELIRRIVADQKGKEILPYLKSGNVGIENMESDLLHPTGKVHVSLSKSGSATYEIAYPSAWDKIEVSGSSRNSGQG